MTEWRFDIENMPKIIDQKNVEVAYIRKNGAVTTAICGWDGEQWVTSVSHKYKIKLCPGQPIYAWKIADPAPPLPVKG